MEPFLGEIRMFSGDYAPKGWATCDGQLLPINQNQALFTILRTTYGGDGSTSFALPNLKGRTPVHRSDEIPRGKGQDQVKVSTGPTSQPGYLALLFIIAMQGVYPQR